MRGGGVGRGGEEPRCFWLSGELLLILTFRIKKESNLIE